MRTLTRLLQDFANWTSAHGIPHIESVAGTAQNIYLRVFWSVIFVMCLTMFSLQMYMLISKFNQKDVTVQTQLKFEERQFPAVTICNVNPYIYESAIKKLAQVEQTGTEREPIREIYELMENYNLYLASNQEDMENEEKGVTLSNMRVKWGLDMNQTDTISAQSTAEGYLLYLAQEMYWNHKPEDRADPYNQMMFHMYEKDMVDDIAIPEVFRRGLIVNCVYESEPCRMNMKAKDSDFIDRIDPSYGRCFTFNNHGKHRSSRAGPLYGLRVLAVSNTEQYLPLTDSIGIRVTIHGPSEQPFPDSFGYNAAAGFTTSFGIKYITTVRKEEPYGKCTDTEKYSQAYNYDGQYTVEGCFRTCYQHMIIKQCKCGDPRLNLKMRFNSTSGSMSRQDEPFNQHCKLTDGDDLTHTPHTDQIEPSRKKCVDEYTGKQTKNSEDDEGGEDMFNAEECLCDQPCKESTYSVTVSTSLWPSKNFAPKECNILIADEIPDDPTIPEDQQNMYPWMINTDSNKTWEWDNLTSTEKVNTCREWFNMNTMLVEVYYERMDYQQLSESEAYGAVNLVSDLGGQLGLWLGVSVITVVEFGSLFSMMLVYCISVSGQNKRDVVSPMGLAAAYGSRQTSQTERNVEFIKRHWKNLCMEPPVRVNARTHFQEFFVNGQCKGQPLTTECERVKASWMMKSQG